MLSWLVIELEIASVVVQWCICREMPCMER
jgi:hypothetical protein